jgi:hypothetical protein
MAVVDLRFPARLRLVHQHGDPVAADFLGQVRRDPPFQRRQARLQVPFVAQPLSDRGLGDPGLEHVRDVVPVLFDLRPDVCLSRVSVTAGNHLPVSSAQSAVDNAGPPG